MVATTAKRYSRSQHLAQNVFVFHESMVASFTALVAGKRILSAAPQNHQTLGCDGSALWFATLLFFSPRHTDIAGARFTVLGNHKPRFVTSLQNLVDIRIRIQLTVDGECSSVKDRGMYQLNCRHDALVLETSVGFCTHTFANSAELLRTRRSKPVQHIKRYLRIEYRLPNALKGKQLPRLAFQFLDPEAAGLGCRVKTNRHYSSQPDFG